MREDIASAIEQQVEFSRLLGSDFTARVLQATADALRAGGPLAELVRDYEGDPVGTVLALRVAGGLRRFALDQRESALAALYPGGARHESATPEALGAAIADAITADPEHFRRYLAHPPQTNEVGRSGLLMAGYLFIARRFGLPLDVREIGASAGLNLCFDDYGYRFGDARWGGEERAVQLAPRWLGEPPPVDAPLSVRSRAACDLSPIDVHDEDAVHRLEAYVWPDQPERLARLRGAVATARARGIRVERESADAWLDAQLAAREPGGVLVVAHSTMWQYLPDAVRERIEATIARAGADASDAAPLAWLSLEPWQGLSEAHVLRLSLWPGGTRHDLATAHPHGTSARWNGGAS